MENVSPPPTNNPPVLPTTLRAKVVQELNELPAISAYIDSHLENIDQFLNGFTQPPNEIDMDDLEPDDESVDTPLVSPFLDSDDDSDDDEVLNKLEEYEGLESTGKNLVAIVRDVYVFVGSFTYIIDFVVLEDIREFILRDMVEVVTGKPFRDVTKLEYDCVKGLMSFTGIFDNYTFQMPYTIPSYRECMRTRSQARRLRQHHRQQQQVPPNLVEPPKDTMADNRTMAELLQAPTEG
ncbi:hypothetical protein Tco_1482197 [Tanacetum coccineum]